jgi:hypothetical protein
LLEMTDECAESSNNRAAPFTNCYVLSWTRHLPKSSAMNAVTCQYSVVGGIFSCSVVHVGFYLTEHEFLLYRQPIVVWDFCIHFIVIWVVLSCMHFAWQGKWVNRQLAGRPELPAHLKLWKLM